MARKDPQRGYWQVGPLLALLVLVALSAGLVGYVWGWVARAETTTGVSGGGSPMDQWGWLERGSWVVGVAGGTAALWFGFVQWRHAREERREKAAQVAKGAKVRIGFYPPDYDAARMADVTPPPVPETSIVGAGSAMPAVLYFYAINLGERTAHDVLFTLYFPGEGVAAKNAERQTDGTQMLWHEAGVLNPLQEVRWAVPVLAATHLGVFQVVAVITRRDAPGEQVELRVHVEPAP